MIQNQTEILIKDNSGMLRGRCINAGKHNQRGSVGQSVKVTVLKSKGVTKRKGGLKKTVKRGDLQDLLLVQTKKLISRNDGSTLRFNGNKGVCVSGGGRGPKLQYGFKRITTAVTVELKKRHTLSYGSNVTKLAKNIL